jgi:hypothetical protein
MKFIGMRKTERLVLFLGQSGKYRRFTKNRQALIILPKSRSKLLHTTRTHARAIHGQLFQLRIILGKTIEDGRLHSKALRLVAWKWVDVVVVGGVGVKQPVDGKCAEMNGSTPENQWPECCFSLFISQFTHLHKRATTVHEVSIKTKYRNNAYKPQKSKCYFGYVKPEARTPFSNSGQETQATCKSKAFLPAKAQTDLFLIIFDSPYQNLFLLRYWSLSGKVEPIPLFQFVQDVL